jgi:hypothetical protein
VGSNPTPSATQPTALALVRGGRFSKHNGETPETPL